MAEQLVDLLQEWGIFGILVSLFIEGSAFPFIGTFFIVTVGFVMELTLWERAWISLVGSFLYAVGSYIPYYIGYKLEGTLIRRLSPSKQELLEKATAAFRKYGIWSVAISSPLHLGNVVPFVAGMARMNLFHYTLLTMLGIAPSTFVLISIGSFYTGDIDRVIETIDQYQVYVLIGFVVITALYVYWEIMKNKRGKMQRFPRGNK